MYNIRNTVIVARGNIMNAINEHCNFHDLGLDIN